MWWELVSQNVRTSGGWQTVEALGASRSGNPDISDTTRIIKSNNNIKQKATNKFIYDNFDYYAVLTGTLIHLIITKIAMY